MTSDQGIGERRMADGNGNGNGNGRGWWVSLVGGGIVGIATLIYALFQLSINPVYREIDDHQRSNDIRFDQMEKGLETLQRTSLTKDEHAEFKLHSTDTVTALSARLSRLESDIVTRAENTTHWNQNQAAEAQTTGEINDIRKQLGSDFTVGDGFKALQSREDQQQARMDQFQIEILKILGVEGQTESKKP